MKGQQTLIVETTPPDFDGIEIREQDAAAFLASLPDGCATLVHADPPWRYFRGAGGANPDQCGIYSGLEFDQIAEHLAASHRIGASGARLLMWATWPKLMESLTSGGGDCFTERAIGWTPVSGGSWHKMSGQALNPGVGYHWMGSSEMALVYRKPGACYRDTKTPLRNAHNSQITDHSEKPIGWLVEMVRRWTRPGDLVVDVYAGLAPLARACRVTGRRYLGCEIDARRASAARARLAQFRPEQA